MQTPAKQDIIRKTGNYFFIRGLGYVCGISGLESYGSIDDWVVDRIVLIYFFLGYGWREKGAGRIGYLAGF